MFTQDITRFGPNIHWILTINHDDNYVVLYILKPWPLTIDLDLENEKKRIQEPILETYAWKLTFWYITIMVVKNDQGVTKASQNLTFYLKC